ncbi:MAG TPA: sphingomyelin phosphodiesterase [Chitinophagales bacterium]|nr:sphingomyelin phosphodiesterase [Chitinophagales bacterium]
MVRLISYFAILIFFFSSKDAFPKDRVPVNIVEVDSLKLLAWNIYMLPPMVGFTGKVKRARAIAESLSSSDYDVLVFSEAFNRRARKRIREGLEHKYPYFIGPAFRKKNSLITSSGVWIVSKYPIEQIAKIKFKRKSGVDNKMARKGALMVQVNKNGQKFNVIGTHMNSKGSLALRLDQLRQIKDELIDQYAEENIPVIVAGDYNILRYNEPGSVDSIVKVLEMEDYQLSGKTRYTYDYRTNHLAIGKTKDELDYVFFKPGNLEVRKVERVIPTIERLWKRGHKHLSDHNPVKFILYYER